MLETREITKRYGDVIANDCITLSIRPSEVIGLLGENGAGKSTLLSVLSGMVRPDAGYLAIDDAPVVLRSPGDAVRHGIEMVHQHFSLVPTLTVREQLRLAGWQSSELPALLEGKVSGNDRIGRLSLGQRQRVEIAKALIRSPRFLLLDEPTSILTPEEIGQLFDLLRAIREQGTTIVLVTHKLDEAIELADRIVVLRHGAVAGSAARPADGWLPGTKSELLELMFGRALAPTGGPLQLPVDVSLRNGTSTIEARNESAHRDAILGSLPSTSLAPAGRGDTSGPGANPETRGVQAVFMVHKLSTRGRTGELAIHEVSFALSAGSICGIVGIDGQGQRELAEALTGYRMAHGEITLSGRSLLGMSASMFADAGIGYLTDDRQREGGVAGLTVAMNLVLKRQRMQPFSRFGVLRRQAIEEEARRLIDTWSIHPSRETTLLDLLSGGNIQKVLLARELAMSPLVLVANKPTHGLDVQTQLVVWQGLREIAERGGGVLFFTTELDEALARSDQIAVIAKGRVSPFVPAHATDRMTLANLMVSAW